MSAVTPSITVPEWPCAVNCAENVSAIDTSIRLRCNHVFHTACFDKQRDIRNRCPYKCGAMIVDERTAIPWKKILQKGGTKHLVDYLMKPNVYLPGCVDTLHLPPVEQSLQEACHRLSHEQAIAVVSHLFTNSKQLSTDTVKFIIWLWTDKILPQKSGDIDYLSMLLVDKEQALQNLTGRSILSLKNGKASCSEKKWVTRFNDNWNATVEARLDVILALLTADFPVPKEMEVAVILLLVDSMFENHETIKEILTLLSNRYVLEDAHKLLQDEHPRIVSYDEELHQRRRKEYAGGLIIPRYKDQYEALAREISLIIEPPEIAKQKAERKDLKEKEKLRADAQSRQPKKWWGGLRFYR